MGFYKEKKISKERGIYLKKKANKQKGRKRKKENKKALKYKEIFLGIEKSG